MRKRAARVGAGVLLGCGLAGSSWLGADPVKIGMIGLDTSHVTAFTVLLHETNRADHVPGARVVARVHDRRNVEKTRRAGAHETVSPDFTGGLRIASAMLRPHAVNLMNMMLHTAENLRVEEVLIPRGSPVVAIEELGRRREWLLVAIRDAQSRWTFNP